MLFIIFTVTFTSITGCKNNSEQSDNEKFSETQAENNINYNNLEFANNNSDELSKSILESLLGKNASPDAIIYDLVLSGKVNDKILRYNIIDNEALSQNGKVTGKNADDCEVIVEVSIGKNKRYYKFTVLGEENRIAEYLRICADNLIHNPDNIKDNLTLPDITGDDKDIKVSWECSDENIISIEPSGENNEIPAGVITRGDADQNVTLKAHLSYTVNGKEYTDDKQFYVTVKALPAKKKYEAYVYTYFRGNIYGDGESQHIHMAVSKDGYFWKAVNKNEPVLKAQLGTAGVRDSFLLRSPYGDKFYLIGTDLDANGGDWADYANNGSTAIRVWESDDLINWSEERLIDIAPKNAGCMWAPEASYDETTGEYIVYFSSGIKGGNGKKIYYVKTRDFYSFTEPQIFKDVSNGTTFIDTTMLIYNNVFYRFTKNENEITIFLETSDSLLGDYSLVKTRIANEWGVEGPAIYQINNEDKWCLYMDGYANENAGVGYFPLIAESLKDLQTGNFRRLNDDEFEMPPGAKHGSFVPITMEEYNAIVNKWGI